VEPTFVPDPVRLPEWPSDLPKPARLAAASSSSGLSTTFVTRFDRSFRHGPWAMKQVISRKTAELARAGGRPEGEELDWSRTLFVDVEAGVHPRGGLCLYLLGVGRFVGKGRGAGDFEVRQHAALTEEGEREVLAAAAAEAAGADWLVTFAGRSFDAPLIAERARAERVDVALPARHLDLFRIAHRLMRRRFADTRLVTLERELLRYERQEDLPSHLIPRAWKAMFEEGNERLLWAIVRHNLLDVVALPPLAAELTLRIESPEEETEQGRLDERDATQLEASIVEARRALEVAPSWRLASAKARVRRLEKKLAALRRESGELDEPESDPRAADAD
jgi:uncharacterized protein YprB with RNaseH-like and TPR domain